MNLHRLLRVHTLYLVNRRVYAITGHHRLPAPLPSAQGTSVQLFRLPPFPWRRLAPPLLCDGTRVAQLFALKPFTPVPDRWMVSAHTAGAAVARNNSRREVWPPLGHPPSSRHRHGSGSGSARHVSRGISFDRTRAAISRAHGSAPARCIVRPHAAPGEQSRFDRLAKPWPFPYARVGFWLDVEADDSPEQGMYFSGVIDVLSGCIISYAVKARRKNKAGQYGSANVAVANSNHRADWPRHATRQIRQREPRLYAPDRLD